MKSYYIIQNDIQKGPFSLEQLKELNLSPSIPVWHDKLDEWITINELQELKETIPPPFHSKSSSPYKMNGEKKKIKASFVVLIIALLVIIGVVIWLINMNSNQSENIETLESNISTQQNFIDHQNDIESERKRINAEITQKNMNFRNNWQNYIQLSNEEPKVQYTLGGISEFTISITNNTSYLLDEVAIYVTYIRKNGDVYQEKTISLFNIPANSIGSEIAPSSLNGVRVNCEVVKIISKKMHFCFPSDNGNREDPYFCK